MSSRKIVLRLDERWYNALNRHLKNETLEEHMEDVLDELEEIEEENVFIVDDDFLFDPRRLRDFCRAVCGDIDHRCGRCYHIRLWETARYAAEHGYGSFTSTLFVSPYQNHEAICAVARAMGGEYGVEFLYRDFRPYFRAGQEFAREHGFYMQKYCGCIFSEEERYMKPKKILP